MKDEEKLEATEKAEQVSSAARDSKRICQIFEDFSFDTDHLKLVFTAFFFFLNHQAASLYHALLKLPLSTQLKSLQQDQLFCWFRFRSPRATF